MSAQPLWQISWKLAGSDDEPFAALVERVFGRAPSLQTNVRTGVTRLVVYATEKQDWVKVRLESLRAEARRLAAEGVPISLPSSRLRRLAAEDWAESWKRHFQPLEVSARLLIRPSWSRRRARAGQGTLVLDPGLSFGTGQHPTTWFCLQEVDRAAVMRPRFTLLDVGTGSGILALAAARLRATRVDAFDFDPMAVRVARENARRNRLTDRVRLRQGDIARLPRRGFRYDVVCANLTADLLELYLPKLAARMQPQGVLVLAGILRQQFDAVLAAACGAGLRCARSRCGGEWKSGAFVSTSPSSRKLTS